MKGQELRIKSLPEMIMELDEETRKTEEWRKAQGLQRSSYSLPLPLITVPVGRGVDDEVDE